MSNLEPRQKLALSSKLLEDAGVFDEQGHLSMRDPTDSESIWINKYSSPGKASLQEFIRFDLNASEFPDGVPMEAVIHSQIYETRDDVTAICHNHSPYAITVSSVGLEMRPVHLVGAVQAEPVTVFEDYEPEGGILITTENEGDKIAKALGDDRAIMLRGHGAVVVGQSLLEAVMGSIKLEYNSKMLYRQAQIGEPWYVPEELLEGLVEMMYSERGMVKSLDYYVAETLD